MTYNVFSGTLNPTHYSLHFRDQLRAQRSVSSMGSLYLYRLSAQIRLYIRDEVVVIWQRCGECQRWVWQRRLERRRLGRRDATADQGRAHDARDAVRRKTRERHEEAGTLRARRRAGQTEEGAPPQAAEGNKSVAPFHAETADIHIRLRCLTWRETFSLVYPEFHFGVYKFS